MTELEALEFSGLKWKVLDLKHRIDMNELERKQLEQEKYEMLKEIKEAEKRYLKNHELSEALENEAESKY